MVLALMLASPAATTESQPFPRFSDSQMAVISKRCHSPRQWLRYDASGALHFHPDSAAKYKRIDCVLGQLKRLSAGPVVIISND